MTIYQRIVMRFMLQAGASEDLPFEIISKRLSDEEALKIFTTKSTALKVPIRMDIFVTGFFTKLQEMGFYDFPEQGDPSCNEDFLNVFRYYAALYLAQNLYDAMTPVKSVSDTVTHFCKTPEATIDKEALVIQALKRCTKNVSECFKTRMSTTNRSGYQALVLEEIKDLLDGNKRLCEKYNNHRWFFTVSPAGVAELMSQAAEVISRTARPQFDRVELSISSAEQRWLGTNEQEAASHSHSAMVLKR